MSLAGSARWQSQPSPPATSWRWSTKDNPPLTVSQLRELITDKTKFILDPEAVAVLDAHIKAGYGDHIPNWRY